MFVVNKTTTETPRNAFEVYKVFAFAPPHILCSLCCVWHLPPTDKLVDFFFFSLDLLKHVHLHFKHVKEMASISAAVTVFGRQAGDVCLCDTDKIHLAADTTVQHVLRGTVVQMGVRENQNLWVSFLNTDKLCV